MGVLDASGFCEVCGCRKLLVMSSLRVIMFSPSGDSATAPPVQSPLDTARAFFADAARDLGPFCCVASLACARVRGWAMRLSQALNLLGRLCSSRKGEGTEEYMDGRGFRGFLAAAMLQEVRCRIVGVIFYFSASPAANRQRERVEYRLQCILPV